MKKIILVFIVLLSCNSKKEITFSCEEIKSSIEENFGLNTEVSVEVVQRDRKNIVDIKFEKLDTNYIDLKTVKNYTSLLVFWEFTESERLLIDSIIVRVSENNKVVIDQETISKVNYLYDYEVGAAVAFLNGLYFENLSLLISTCNSKEYEFDIDSKDRIEKLIAFKGLIETFYFNGFDLEEDGIKIYLQMEHFNNIEESYFNFFYANDLPLTESLCEIKYLYY